MKQPVKLSYNAMILDAEQYAILVTAKVKNPKKRFIKVMLFGFGRFDYNA